MAQSRRNRWVEVIGVIVTLAVAGGLLYALLPLLVRPDQQVVPPLPKSASDPTQALQAFLMMFIPMTAIGAPITMAIVLALIVRVLSPRLPASSAVASATTPTAKLSRPIAAAPKDLSPREVMWWKIIATLLVLISIAGITVLLWPTLVRLFS